MSHAKVKRSDLKFGNVLGIGGFSTVYQAIWTLATTRLSQEVAVKKLNTIETGELDIMSKLDHSHIVKLLGVVDETPDFFLVLELCTGGTLRQYLDTFTKKRLPFTQFLDWTKQAVSSIKYLREKGVVHKDIKSPNYLITGGNILKLSDFGIAKEITQTMSNATKSASYPWMAPELLVNLKLSPNYDMFSFGVVVWELWTTDSPYKDLEWQVVGMKVCSENQRLHIPDDCPKPIVYMMRQCWDSDWTKRPSIDHVLSVIADTKAAVRQTQLINGPWKLKRKIGDDGPGKVEWPCGIATTTDQGDVCVADYVTPKVQVYSQQGIYKFSLDTNRGLEPETCSYPRGVAVSSDGTFYITDNTQFVKVYGSDGKYTERWSVISPQHVSSYAEDTCLIGLTIDCKGQLLVGETNQRYISKHRQDNSHSHIDSIQVGIKPNSLAVTSQDAIIISDWALSVHIVNSAGQLLHQVNCPTHVQRSRWTPGGIACNGDIICICDFYNNNKCIHCFSVCGAYLGDIPITIPGRPKCLAFTADGKQVMVTYKTSEIGGDVAMYTLQSETNDAL